MVQTRPSVATKSYRNLQKLETCLTTCFRGFPPLQSPEEVTNPSGALHAFRSSGNAWEPIINLQRFRSRSHWMHEVLPRVCCMCPSLPSLETLKRPGLQTDCVHPTRSPCSCLQVGYCRMLLSGPASHAAFASVASGIPRRQACAVKRQTMTCH